MILVGDRHIDIHRRETVEVERLIGTIVAIGENVLQCEAIVDRPFDKAGHPAIDGVGPRIVEAGAGVKDVLQHRRAGEQAGDQSVPLTRVGIVVRPVAGDADEQIGIRRPFETEPPAQNVFVVVL